MPVSTHRVVYLFILQLLFVTNISPAFAENKSDVDPAVENAQVNKSSINKDATATHSAADEKRLLTRLKDIKTVSTRFVQKLYTSNANKPQVTEGTLTVAGGDKFRLEYTKPYEQIYVANGKEFLFYDVDLEQITIKPQPDELANTPAMILSNPVIFVKKYFVKLNSESESEEYILSAREETSAYNKVLLSFRDNRLASMLIEDSFGQETELDFYNMVYNKKIPNSTFNYTPPEGVDVIRSTDQIPDPIKAKLK